jgi:type III restriction enzyme
MKFKFENQDYQLQAVSSIVKLFAGMQSFNQQHEQIHNSTEILSCDVVANELLIDDNLLLNNLQQVQSDNQLNSDPNFIYGNYIKTIGYPNIANFSVEMETGTGKTYVYLRSIFALNQKYKLKKFIIVVPSDAIRAGTIKTLSITMEHFKAEFNNVNYDYYAYDSNKGNQARDFATSDAIQIMIITIASFNKESNNINKYSDKYGEHKPIDLIRATNPVVILDEPQSIDNTPNAQKAIKDLNPLFITRYSATHRELYNQVYKLDAIDAHAQKLVKQIEVTSIVDDDNFIADEPYIKVVNITPKLEVSLELDVIGNNGVSKRKVLTKLKRRQDLQLKTNNDIYHNYIIENISRDRGVQFANLDRELAIGDVVGNNAGQNNKLQAMIRVTILNHIQRELRLADKNIKVLSLFFINRVADYRLHTNNSHTDGHIAKMFIEQFNDLMKTNDGKKYIQLCRDKYNLDLTDSQILNKLHDGYFAKDKQGNYKDCKEDTQDAVNTYELIMKNKEELLNRHNPLRFIFSHSALKEGWDNPNVFQVCVLQDSSNTFKRRQQIGRGMRLCVDANGSRIFENNINQLTIIAAESYQQFAANLQKEYEQDANISFINKKLPIKNSRDKIKISINKKVINSKEFQTLWQKIRKKTIYSIELDTEKLITKTIEALSKLDEVDEAKLTATRAKITFANTGIDNELQENLQEIIIQSNDQVGLIDKLMATTNLTRSTIGKILLQSNKLQSFTKNQRAFLWQVTECIEKAKRELIVDGIRYQKIDELDLGETEDVQYYSQQLFADEDNGYKDKDDDSTNVAKATDLKVGNELLATKFLFDMLRYDSDNEITYFRDQIAKPDTKLIVKLPKWFKVNTPLGNYNPDWAIVKKNTANNSDYPDDIYLIVETKDKNHRGFDQEHKTKCAKKHFTTLKVDYKIELVQSK